ncbi:tetratricopeptide repeat protein [Thiomicrorhabdus sp. zzn3]|uniref:YfgM family protein n=1 Tax=Thiomicrorhabdus sp. zzn3 TaxID=3039775 RepID=UPI002436C1A3|nr:tetratricopeptide repeat protein [Thiomicrorhabdus sp. zzn3]MDG6778444.1 tetratricopeptide repeat protein [Thiomicrorhabdus sp. zzn3]
MSRYETEEEQIEAIKSWWKKNGTQLLTLILVVVVAISGWRYWNHQQAVKATNASAIFEILQANMQQGTFGEVSREGLKLIQEQPESPYASGAALLLAKFSLDKGDVGEAKHHLEWVRVNGADAALKQVATLRLARLLADQKEYSQAQEMLTSISSNQLPAAEKANFDYVSGLIALGQEDKDAARQSFAKVVENMDASKTLKGIAQIQLDDLAA